MKKLLPFLVLAVFGAVSGYFLISNKATEDPLIEEGSAIEVEANEEVAVEEVPKPTAHKYAGQAMEYLADQTALAKYPVEFVEEYQRRLRAAIAGTKNEPQSSDHWTEIGIVKKTFDNYTGARDAWEYAKLIEPNGPLTWYNLAGLYGAYLGNLTEAERHYKKAIALAPRSALVYLGFADFYRDFYKERSDQADDILIAGMKAIPDEANFPLGLGFYYKSAGDKERAISYFEKFLTYPGLDGAQRSAVEAEIASLK